MTNRRKPAQLCCRLALTLAMLVTVGCPESPAQDADAALAPPDAGDGSTPADAAPDDSAVDAPPPDASYDAGPSGWNVSFPDQRVASVARLGDTVYVLTAQGSGPTHLFLHTVVDGTITATQAVPGFAGGLAVGGGAVYLYVQFFDVVDAWGQSTGAAGKATLLLVRLDGGAQPVWRHVDSDQDSIFLERLSVDSSGRVTLSVTESSGGGFFSSVRHLAAESGQVLGSRSLEPSGTAIISSNGKLFAQISLFTGQSFAGHTATGEERLLVKYPSISSFAGESFVRVLPAEKSLLGLRNGDPIVIGRNADGRTELSRLSGASGATLWTYVFDASRFPRYQLASRGNELVVFGSVDDRIDFSPSVRIETSDSGDLFVASFDATTGTFIGAHQLGSAASDGMVDFLPGPCALLAGNLGGPMSLGQELLDVPPEQAGGFVTTMCR